MCTSVCICSTITDLLQTTNRVFYRNSWNRTASFSYKANQSGLTIFISLSYEKRLLTLFYEDEVLAKAFLYSLKNSWYKTL